MNSVRRPNASPIAPPTILPKIFPNIWLCLTWLSLLQRLLRLAADGRSVHSPGWLTQDRPIFLLWPASSQRCPWVFGVLLERVLLLLQVTENPQSVPVDSISPVHQHCIDTDDDILTLH